MTSPKTVNEETPRPALSEERVRALFAKQRLAVAASRVAGKRPAEGTEAASPVKTVRREELTKRRFRAAAPAMENRPTAGGVEGAGDERAADVTTSVPVTEEPTNSANNADGPEEVGTAGNAAAFFKSLGKIKIPLPQPGHPFCTKVKPGLRYVPHPEFSLPRKALKEMGFVYPAVYGATMVEREIASDLSADNLMDLSHQKGGETLFLSDLAGVKYRAEIAALDKELGRARAAGERLRGDEDLIKRLRSENQQLVLEKEEAIRAKEEVLRQRDELKGKNDTACAELVEKAKRIRELEGKLTDAEREVGQLKSLVSSAEARAELSESKRKVMEEKYEDDVIADLRVSLGILKRKAQSLFPGADVDWDTLMDLKEADFDTYRAPQ